ncbi:hypothetical protein G6F50_015406 [Rhizopus delemar]|uniref:Uncharacterized protein n=1 Tax=Rhizopus delemar TaxID=936053 RepID=A0A9P6XYM0_9FUNG|nr:hypothetical protein G6F50_015406 [Rhizopus delemar]
MRPAAATTAASNRRSSSSRAAAPRCRVAPARGTAAARPGSARYPAAGRSRGAAAEDRHAITARCEAVAVGQFGDGRGDARAIEQGRHATWRDQPVGERGG